MGSHSRSGAAPSCASRPYEALAPLVVGATLDELAADIGAFWRRLVSDSQLRWVGPEKGVIHLATAAIVNAVWDLWAKVEGKPLWKLLADMTPEEIVALRRLPLHQDALTPDEALEILRRYEPTRREREGELLRERLSRRTRRRPAGSATRRRRFGERAARRSAPGCRTSS